MTPCWYVLGLHVQEEVHTEKAYEYGFESLAFEWGHDLRISQQGEKVMCHFLLCDRRQNVLAALW